MSEFKKPERMPGNVFWAEGELYLRLHLHLHLHLWVACGGIVVSTMDTIVAGVSGVLNGGLPCLLCQTSDHVTTQVPDLAMKYRLCRQCIASGTILGVGDFPVHIGTVGAVLCRIPHPLIADAVSSARS